MKKIVLYGTGLEGEKFYWRWKDEYEIVFCIDKFHKDTFHGIPVYDISKVKDKLAEYFIVIAGRLPHCIDMEKNLKEMGLSEFINYTFSERMDKKLAILYGNCHMDVLERYLNSNPKFADEYYIKRFFVAHGEVPDENDLSHCNLLIGQDIWDKGGHSSIEQLKSQTKESCLKIVIPNLYGTNLYFPQVEKGALENYEGFLKHFAEDALGYRENHSEQKNAVKNIGFLDVNLNTIWNGLPVEVIKNKIENEIIYNKEDIISRFEREIEKLKNREEKCDIVISDYILEHYQQRQLFYDPCHPIEEVICEKGRRILDFLGIEIIEYDKICRLLDGAEIFIYGCVKLALALEFQQDYIRIGINRNYTLRKKPLCLEEWIEDCLRWNGRIIEEDQVAL